MVNTIQHNHESALTVLNTKLRRLTMFIVVSVLLILVAVAALGFVLWRQRALEKQQSDLAFSLAASD